MSAHSHPQPCCSTDKRLESTAAHSMACTASAWNGLGLCSSRKIGEGRERGMEGGRKGSRQRRRVVEQLKMRCCSRGECSPFRCSSCRHVTTHCELYFEAGVLLVHEGQDKLFCALHANSPQQGSGSVLLSCPVCPCVHALHSSQGRCSSKTCSHLLLCVTSVRQHSCFVQLNQV